MKSTEHEVSVSRREFVGTVALATAAAFSGPQPARAQGPDWFERPMRWAQLAFVENDPGNYDKQFWLDYFDRLHIDAVCLSAGGCVAFYPTEIPLHYRSAWMGDTDPFGELAAACREAGRVIVARTDPHAVRRDAFNAHPEWIAVDAEGNKRPHWAAAGRWVTCGLGPYNFEFMTEVHKEIVSKYKVDGIFINRWSGSGMCYCESCQRSFRVAYKMDLPRTNDPQDPARRNYVLWRQQRLFDLWQLWDGEMRKIHAGSHCIPNTGGGATSSLDMKKIGELTGTLMADRQGRRGVMTPWAAGKNGKEYRAALGSKPVVGIFSVGLTDSYRWKDSVQSEPELRIWAADSIANGMRPWFTKFAGVLHDERWLPAVEKIYKWHYSAERYLRNEKPLARVGVVYSQQTAWFYGGPEAGDKVEDHIEGMYQALIERRIPFEMVHDRMLDAEHVDRFKALILPNVAALSDGQCRQIREYVERGGSVLATFETSLYDEWGKRRNELGLADLFGVTFNGDVERRMQNSYLMLHHDTGHPILAGLEDAARIVNGGRRVDVSPRAAFPDPPVTHVPTYPDLPMEEVYPRVLDSGHPEVFLREIGDSRVVYFPWDADRIFWEVLAVDHGKLLGNAVEWVINEDRPATVTGPGLLDVTVWKQKDSMTVHLVNLTNPMAFKGAFREFFPVGEQTVEIVLPPGARPKKVQLLVAGGTPQTEEANGRLTVTVPSVLDHEVIAVDL